MTASRTPRTTTASRAAAARRPRLRLSIQGDAAFAALPSRATLRRWTSMALDRDATLVLRFVAIPEARRLNRDFRGKDHATNVLTFDYMEAPARADIVVCVPVVKSEAHAQGKTFRDHLLHLIIHGVLHAQGHDHATPGQARRMEGRERRLLARLGVSDPYQ